MRTKQLAALVFLLVQLTCVAQVPEAKTFAGTWVMRLGERILFVLTLTSNGANISGSFDRPAEFFSEGNTLFSNMHGGLRHDRVMDSHLSKGVLQFTVSNPTDLKNTAQYTMSIDENRAKLVRTTPDDPAPNNPYIFQRAAAGVKVSTDWEPNRAYSANDLDTPNPEMKTLYDEDQRVRSIEPINWDIVSKSDTQRREQTRKLLAKGALHTGHDYEEAAFIFQHGQSPDDYLLAHTLAMVAVSKGDAGALWIATATFDRYLQRIGQKQIYGTQYGSDATHPWNQEPFNRDLVSDALREQLGAQSNEVDQERLKFLRLEHALPAAK